MGVWDGCVVAWQRRPSWCCRRGAPRATGPAPRSAAAAREAVRTASARWRRAAPRAPRPAVRDAVVLGGCPVRGPAAAGRHRLQGRGPARPARVRWPGCWPRRSGRRCGRPGAAPASGARGGVLVVPVPTARASRRRRGDDPVRDLAVRRSAVGGGPVRAAARLDGLVVVRPWPTPGAVADQAHLDRGARAANLAGAMAVREAVARGGAGRRLRARRRRRDDRGDPRRGGPRPCDEAGARHVVAATVAATPRRSRPALVAHRTSD